MHQTSDGLSLAPTDLGNFLACRHLAVLDLAAARGSARPPLRYSPMLEDLRERGMEHEKAYLDRLWGKGRAVVDAAGRDVRATIAEMRGGVDVRIRDSRVWSRRPPWSTATRQQQPQVLDRRLRHQGDGGYGATQYGDTDIAEAVRAVEMAVDHGITLFDTAEVYGPFTSEELLARGLGAQRKDVVVVTKVGFAYRDDANARSRAAVAGRDASPAHVAAHADDCLGRLDTDYIDLLLIHSDHKTPHEETIGALEALKQTGKIRHYGVFNYDVAMMRECERHGHLAANQMGYHLFDRRMEAEVLPFCGEAGIGFMAYGSLGLGLMTGAFRPETTFVDWDWRSCGTAFGLPLFEGESFLAEKRDAAR